MSKANDKFRSLREADDTYAPEGVEPAIPLTVSERNVTGKITAVTGDGHGAVYDAVAVFDSGITVSGQTPFVRPISAGANLTRGEVDTLCTLSEVPDGQGGTRWVLQLVWDEFFNVTGCSAAALANAAPELLTFFNGTFQKSFNALVTSDGTTITLSLTASAGGDLTMTFSDGTTVLDVTPAKTIQLTAGTQAAPQENYIYILQSTKALTCSTTDWPTSEEHIKVTYALVQAASDVQNTGALINQNWNDHNTDDNNQGHLTHMTDRSRRLGAIWHSGCEGVATQDSTDLWVSIAAGEIFQMHRHAFAALDSDSAGAADVIHVINDPDAAYTQINSLNEITKLSDGASIGQNRYVKFVLIGVANKGGTISPMLLNLPSGEYVSAAGAATDVDGHANFTLPDEFNLESSTGFLVAAFVCKHSSGSGMEIQSTQDLRGQTPSTVAGAGTGGGDVTSAAAMTDNAIVRGDGGAKGVQDSGILIDDSDNVTGVTTMAIDVTTGTAPLTITSTTLVSNLNADLLDSQTGSYYLDSDNFTGTEWTDLTDSGGTTLHTHTFGNISQVDIAGAGTGDILVRGGVNWEDSSLISVAAARVTISTSDVAIPNIPSGGGVADLRVAADGDIMYNVSSERFKTDIEAWSVGDNDIFGPSAVSFRFKDEAWDRALYQEKDEGGNEYDIIEYGDPNCRKSIGWSAEDMFKHAPDAVILDAEGKPYNIDWHAITLMLWSELKRLRARVAVVDGGAG